MHGIRNLLKNPNNNRLYDRRIDMKHYFNSAVELLDLEKKEIPQLIKGVRGTSSASDKKEWY